MSKSGSNLQRKQEAPDNKQEKKIPTGLLKNPF